MLVSGKLLDLEKKMATFKPLVKSLSVENETLKNKVVILTIEAENDKECVASLEKSLQVDKQIDDLELKLYNFGTTVVQDFKDFDEYYDELCKYYVEGFDLLVKWMAKHHPGLDLSGLTMDDVEKELMFDRPYKATAENMTEEATDIAEVMKEATITTPADPVPDEQ